MKKQRRQRQLTPEDIASHYSAAMDSVNLINGSKPDIMTNDEWTQCLLSNKMHLEIMLTKDYWTTEDLNPLKLAALK